MLKLAVLVVYIGVRGSPGLSGHSVSVAVSARAAAAS
jgi:hypothetical protein